MSRYLEERPRRALTDRERRRVLLALDALAGALAIAVVYAWGAAPEDPLARRLWRAVFSNPVDLATLGLAWLLMAHAFELYEGRVRARLGRSLGQALKAALVGAGLYLAAAFTVSRNPPPMHALWLLPTALWAFAGLGRGLYRLALGRLKRPTLVLGTGERARAAAETLRRHGGDTYRLEGLVEDADDLPTLVRDHGIATVVLTAPEAFEGESGDRLAECVEAGAELEPLPLLVERLERRIPLDRLEDWPLSFPTRHGAGRLLDRAGKRLMDLVLTSVGTLVMLPFVPLIAAAIYVESPGPIFYFQDRVGRYGTVFRVPKFRSMIPDAEREGAVWAREEDPRITRVGRVLRAMHVDEFPQFLNILRGQMSVIGPRPERPEFVEELAREVPYYRARHAMKPGLGGWGLVNQGYGASGEDARVKHEYDLYYIRHQSFWLDLVILARTFVDTFTFGGR